MTMHNELGLERRFVSSILPWVAAAGGLIVYLVTLNPWISFGNLAATARITGETWSPEVYGPLYYLATFPLRWLPESWVPLALNLFSAVCAALTLGLLARSVVLLPHDRTHEQRQREKNPFSLLSIRQAWIPPTLAVAALGLQQTFWEHATAGSSELFDLLLFAYIIRSLMEYRIDEHEPRLLQCALIYGAAMTTNWAMIGFLPVFVTALIWMRGFSFFNLRFLSRMALFGLGGLLLYLLLPLIQVFSDSSLSFWEALKANLVAQKLPLAILWQRVPNNILLLLSMTSLLPLLVIGIRWASYFGDSSPLGVGLATWLFHLVHAALLGACVWVMFDPTFSPRQFAGRLPFAVSFLTLYYLSVISIGYLSGYFLLVFRPLAARMQRQSPAQKVLHRAAVAAVLILLFIVPIGLLYKNLPPIRSTNGPGLRNYARLAARQLPERTLVLSDDPSRLVLVQLALRKEGGAGGRLFVHTQSLTSPDYHRYLERKYPGDWTSPPQMQPDRPVAQILLLSAVVRMAQTRPIYYLHPSFGYYFEEFYLQPHGTVYKLRQYPTNVITRPPLTEADIAENETFWQEAGSELIDPLLPHVAEPDTGEPSGFRARFMRTLHLPVEPNFTARLLAGYYSRELNYWGVEVQRAGRLDAAAAHFERASKLNPNNIVAAINRDFNQELRSGLTRPAGQKPVFLEEQLANLERALNSYGPFDEPELCFEQARVFVRGRLFRQAAQLFERVRELAPEHLASRLWLGRLYVAARMPDRALTLVDELRARSDSFAAAGVTESDVLQIELGARFAAKETEQADQLVQDAIREHPRNEPMLAGIARVCTMYGSYTNALIVLERQLALKPRDPPALANKGFVHLQLGNLQEAIPPLNQALALQPTNYPVLLNRAVALLRNDQLDEAQQDYEILRQVFTNNFRIHYGLGEIAWRRQDTNAAIQHYEAYMASPKPNSREIEQVTERLHSLKGTSP